jgi:hypothetical protein
MIGNRAPRDATVFLAIQIARRNPKQVSATTTAELP